MMGPPLLALLVLLLAAGDGNAHQQAPRQQHRLLLEQKEEAPGAATGNTTAWTVQQYPNPTKADEAKICAPFLTDGSTSYLCDPDAILTQAGAMKVHEMLNRINAEDVANCTSAPGGKERVEVGVALVHGLHRTASSAQADVYAFSQGIHEKWQLGTDACKLGVVIAVSQVERTMIIWIGNGLENVLTQGRVSEISRSVQPHFHQGKFDDGVLTAVEMVERDILQGPVIESREEESSWDPSTVFVIVITLVVAACALGGFTACVCKCLKHQRDLEEYDRVKAKLKRIERERTRLASIDLAGTYNALLSCPICLENFKDGPPLEENDHGAVRRGKDKLGADDKPVSILACGHAYCVTCLHEAIGRHHTKRCPICRREVDEPGETKDDLEAGEARTGTRGASEAEMRFRLRQLQHQHPRFITADMVSRWSTLDFITSNNTFVSDSAFVSSHPSHHHTGSGGDSGSGGGGGTSSFWFDGGGCGGDFGGGGGDGGGGGCSW